MSIDEANATETLQCYSCGHSLTTGKTIGKPDTLEVKCPKCQASAPLQIWRNRFEQVDFVPDLTELPPAVPSPVPTPRIETLQPAPKRDVASGVANGFVQLSFFLLACLFGLAAIIATVATVIPMFTSMPTFRFDNQYAPGLTANVIQRIEQELAMIRYLLSAVVLWFLTLSIVNFSKKFGPQ